MDFVLVKMVVFVPVTHGDAVRKVLAEAGVGKMGKYDSCSFSVKGVGRFRPLKGADPFVGDIGEMTEVEEERIEVVCLRDNVDVVLKAVSEVHPYEEPVIDVSPLVVLPPALHKK